MLEGGPEPALLNAIELDLGAPLSFLLQYVKQPWEVLEPQTVGEQGAIDPVLFPRSSKRRLEATSISLITIAAQVV